MLVQINWHTISKTLFLRRKMKLIFPIIHLLILLVNYLATNGICWAEDSFIIQNGFGVESVTIPINLFGQSSGSSSSASDGSQSASSCCYYSGNYDSNSYQSPYMNSYAYPNSYFLFG